METFDELGGALGAGFTTLPRPNYLCDPDI